MFPNDVDDVDDVDDDDDDDSLADIKVRRGLADVVAGVDATSDVRGKDSDDDPQRTIRPRAVTTDASRHSRTMVFSSLMFVRE